MGTIAQDIRYALRQLRKAPGFTFTAVLTLALGVGANAAIFSLINTILLRSLPVGNPRQLYRVGDNDHCCVWGGLQTDWGLFSYPLYEYLRDHTPQFESIAAFQSWSGLALSVRPAGSNAPAQTQFGEFVTGNYFSTLGVPAFAGRMLTADDDRKGAAPVVIVSYRLWQQRFGLDPGLVGKPLVISGNVFTVAGIAPPGFFGDRITSDPPDIWIPMAMEPVVQQQGTLLPDKRSNWLYLIGRLRSGEQPSAVAAQMQVELRQWLGTEMGLSDFERTQIDKQTLHLGPGGSGVRNLQLEVQQGLYLLMAASALVLLIACANLANLMLARAAARRLHTTIQLALGASGRRLVRAVMTESVLLALMGGAVGLLVAYNGSRALLLLAFRSSRYVPISNAISWPVLEFTFAVSVLTGMLFGTAPAWLAARSDPADALRGGTRSTQDHAGLPQKSLVVVQAALSLVLLAAAGLVTQSLRNLQNQSYGFQRDHRYMASMLEPSKAGYKPEQLPELYRRLQDDLGRIPGVRHVALAMYAPQSGDNWSEGMFIEGRKHDPRAKNGSSWNRVSPDFFTTMGIPLLRGRSITEQDTPASPAIAVVNQAFVKRFFPNEDPIGRHFGKGDETHAGDFEIVGVVGDVKYQSQTAPPYPMAFVPLLQRHHYKTMNDEVTENRSVFISNFILHVDGKPAGLEEQVRRTLAGISPDLALLHFASYDEQIGDNLNQEKLLSRLTSLFSGLALLLASVGLYGVTSYRVARRTGEIGIRMALGANPRDVMMMVLRGAFSQIGLGLLIGIPLALGAGRLLASKLFGVHGYDPIVLGGAVAVLGICALLASAAPARRAATVQPMQALRSD